MFRPFSWRIHTCKAHFRSTVLVDMKNQDIQARTMATHLDPHVNR